MTKQVCRKHHLIQNRPQGGGQWGCGGRLVLCTCPSRRQEKTSTETVFTGNTQLGFQEWFHSWTDLRKMAIYSLVWQCTAVIPALWGCWGRGSQVQVQPGQLWKTLSQNFKNYFLNNVWKWSQVQALVPHNHFKTGTCSGQRSPSDLKSFHAVQQDFIYRKNCVLRSIALNLPRRNRH